MVEDLPATATMATAASTTADHEDRANPSPVHQGPASEAVATNVPSTIEPNVCDASSETIETAALEDRADRSKAEDRGGGSDGGLPTNVSKAAAPGPLIRFQTHHADLSVMAEVLAIMVPPPAESERGADTKAALVMFEIAPEGLHVDLGTPNMTCRVQASFARGSSSIGAGRFYIPAQILRLAAMQRPKQEKPRKKKTQGTRRLASRMSLRPNSSYDVHDGPMLWVIDLHSSHGRLAFATTEINFDASPATSLEEPITEALGEPRVIAPERIRRALVATRPAAATDREGSLALCQVATADGCTRATNGRMYAHHRDSALADLRFRVARGDIETLASLMHRLDRTATTLRCGSDRFLLEDGRLTVGFRQPTEEFLNFHSIETLQPSLTLNCGVSDLRTALDRASILIPSTTEAKQQLQVRLALALSDGAIVLQASAIWQKGKIWGMNIAITTAPEQLHDLRARLGAIPRVTVDDAREVEEADELPTSVPSPAGDGDLGRAELTCTPIQATWPTIELGRYPYAEFDGCIKLMRASLLRIEFIDAKAILISERATDYTTTYLISARAENTAPGLPRRRSRRRG